MSSGALKNEPKQKSGRALALPAPPPPRPLFVELQSLLCESSSRTLVISIFMKCQPLKKYKGVVSY